MKSLGLRFVLPLLALPLFIAGCGGGGSTGPTTDPDPDTSPTSSPTSNLARTLSGGSSRVWYESDYYPASTGVEGQDALYTFKSNGTGGRLRLRQNVQPPLNEYPNAPFAWSVSGNTLTLQFISALGGSGYVQKFTLDPNSAGDRIDIDPPLFDGPGVWRLVD